jgi:hypothetical protein
MDTFDLSHDLCEAKQNLEGWKWLHGEQKYPHIIAENMMRRVYAMDLIWKDFESRELPSFSTLTAFLEMESIYQEKVQQVVNPNLSEWLDFRRSTLIGGISYAYWDGLATPAETNDSILEEIEFSYIFHFLVDKCVLYWIAYCQSGVDPKTAMGRMTGKVFANDEDYTYDKMKAFFQEELVKIYMHKHMPNGAQEHSFVFLGDKFSQPTSNISAYICSTPGLCSYIESHPKIKDMETLWRGFELYCYDKGCLTPLIRTRMDNIRKNYPTTEENLDKFRTVDLRKALKDGYDIEEYNRRLVQHEEIVDFFAVCEHPYVCSQIARDLLKNEKLKAKGLSYLQEALNAAFSFPNPFLHNKEAIYGCVDALAQLSDLLSIVDKEDFKELFGFSLFKVRYLLLKRSVCLSTNTKETWHYKWALADLIDENRQEITKEEIRDEYIEYYISYLRCTNEYSEGKYYLAEILFRQFESNVYNLYWIGNLHIEERDVADLMRFLQVVQSDHTMTLSLFFAEVRYHSIHPSTNNSPNTWSKIFTEEEQRKIDIATLKDAASEYRRFFEGHKIDYLYHFTDRKNIDSIKQYGGLFSCRYLKNNQIATYSGGDEELQRVDREFGLDDYVRLSFIPRHPMGRRLKINNNRDFVVLKIRKDVAFSKDTLFSDVNAATQEHHHGGGIEDLKAVNLEIINIDYASMDSVIHEKKTAEVMIKNHIPIEYILNIDNPDSF